MLLGGALLILPGGEVGGEINKHGSYYTFLKIGVSIKEIHA